MLVRCFKYMCKHTNMQSYTLTNVYAYLTMSKFCQANSLDIAYIFGQNKPIMQKQLHEAWSKDQPATGCRHPEAAP